MKKALSLLLTLALVLALGLPALAVDSQPIYLDTNYNTTDKDVSASLATYAALYVREDGVQAAQSETSAILSGTYDGVGAQNLVIVSADDNVCGIRTGGTVTYTVENADITLTGNGANDFQGAGAALAATDASTLIVKDSTVKTSGVIRGAYFVGGTASAGGGATLECYNTTFSCDPGEYAASSIQGAGMTNPPAGLGVYGNCRLGNLVHDGTAYFESCSFTSRNWGVLGVDAVNVGHMTCVDCDISTTESGYGAYAIGEMYDVFQGCRFNITGGVFAFVAVNGSVEFSQGTTGVSDRYGIVTHQAMNMVSNILVTGVGTDLQAKYCGILVKGRSSDIAITDGAVVSATDGPILQAMDNDDTGAGTVNANAAVNVAIADTALSGDIVMSMAPKSGSDAAMNVTLTGATLDGAVTLANSVPFIADGKISQDNILDVGRTTNTYGFRGDASYLNLTLQAGSVWNVTEASYLTTLTVEDGATVNGTVYEISADTCVVVPVGETCPEIVIPLNANPTVAVSDQALSVGGAAAPAACYNCDGSNYFKLRDLAALLTGTAAQFDVSYDQAANAVVITTGQAYTPLDTDLVPVSDPVSVVVSGQRVVLDGQEVALNAYNIDGSNYFGLRDLGEVLGFGVDYDEATRTMLIAVSLPDAAPAE